MDYERNAISGVITFTESSVGVRALTAAIALVAAIALYVMPADSDPMNRVIWGAMLVGASGMAIMAVSRTIVFDPRSSDLTVVKRGILGERSQRIPIARIESIRLESHHGSDASDVGAQTSFGLVAVLKTGKRIDLSSSTSWHRGAKRAAGNALARAIGVSFEA